MTYDPIVFRYKSAYMQRIADYVRLGYNYWVQGEVLAERAAALVDKFDRLYGVGRSRHQRAYARQKGDACAVLLLYAPSSAKAGQPSAAAAPTAAPLPPTPTLIRWTLLVTPGEHLARRLETLKNATKKDGRVALSGYELVLMPRPGQERPAWTWRMTKSTYEGWRVRLMTAARRSARAAGIEIAELARTPGFAGCRAQCKKLQQLARAELLRRHPGDAGAPLPRVRYLQRVADEGLTLRAWVKRLAS